MHSPCKGPTRGLSHLLWVVTVVVSSGVGVLVFFMYSPFEQCLPVLPLSEAICLGIDICLSSYKLKMF